MICTPVTLLIVVEVGCAILGVIVGWFYRGMHCEK